MDIQAGKSSDAMEIFDLITRCRVHLASQHIFQWDEVYPGLKDVEQDLREGTLFVVYDATRITAAACFNADQPHQYQGIPWRCAIGKALVAHRVCVDPAHEGKGHGRALMLFGEDFGKKKGFSCIRLDAYTGNPRSAHFYRKLGYVVHGQVFFPRRPLPFDCLEKIII